MIAPDRKPCARDQKTHGVSNARPTILRTCNFLEAISAAPMAPRYCSRSEASCKRSEKLMESQKRDPTFCGPVKFWKRSQPRPWRPVIGPDRKPFVSDQKIHGVSQARSNILRACNFLEAISAAPMAPRYRSRSEASCKRSENSWSLNSAIRQFAGL